MRISPLPSFMPELPGSAWRRARRALVQWGEVLYFGAVAAVFMLTPSSHDARSRVAMARLLHATTWQTLPWFGLLCALVSLAVSRIVVVTAQSYGLSQLAQEMVVRVLVLELIPLAAALFVLLRVSMVGDLLPVAREVVPMRRIAAERWRLDLMPRVLALGFAVVALATASAVLALVLSYTAVYGLSPAGFDPFTRMVGRVFDPAVSLGLALKTALFSMAVAVVPMASALHERVPLRTAGGFTARSGTLRVLFVLVLVQAGSLAVRYF